MTRDTVALLLLGLLEQYSITLEDRDKPAGPQRCAPPETGNVGGWLGQTSGQTSCGLWCL